jgi:hypothetical protein
MSRRRFLAGGAGVAAVAGGVGLARLLGDDDWMARVTGFPAGDPAYRWVAQHYLRLYPEEASPARLIELLGFDPATLADLDGDEAAQLLFRSIQHDVARDDLVALRRWLLTRSEARLCALGSLLAEADLQAT